MQRQFIQEQQSGCITRYGRHSYLIPGHKQRLIELRTLGGVINFSMFRPQPDYSQPERFPYTEQMVGMLSQLGTTDALAAAILMVHESATISSQPLRILALQTYREL